MFTKYAHLFLFLLVIGCGGVQVAREDTPIPLTRVGEHLRSVDQKDPFLIEGNDGNNPVTINGDVLRISVSYRGGCKDHDFSLIWNGLELESFLPQLNLFLVHDAHGDTCDTSINKILEFDLTSLKRPPIDRIRTIKLNIFDYTKKMHGINYHY